MRPQRPSFTTSLPTRTQVEKKKQMEKIKRDELNEKYHDLLDKHRQYVKTVHDFQEECRKNEILVNKLNI